MKKTWIILLSFALVVILAAGCGNSGNQSGTQGGEQQSNGGQEQNQESPQTLKNVTVMLDWAPNTNHTGMYVAQSNGYYAEEGLDVTIISAGETGVETAVAAGNVEFGVSYQENVTVARTSESPILIVSIAAVIQHNTSGFASPADKGIVSPKDFEGKVYGGWGSPSEIATIQSVMQAAGADYDQLTVLDTGYTEFFTAVEKDIDFGWIYYGWDGVQAELKDVPLNMIYLRDLSEKLDYYTPVLIASERMIENDADTVRAFLAATSKGYAYAIEHPEEAADLLLNAEPDLDAELVKASQVWLADQYQADASRWGEQKLEVWKNYADWMLEHELLEQELNAEQAFTNEFLPE
ncbi:ABC transporter substrate-binding protein [Xylanibacillus composti]|uniref:ABC transporter substrate-binding protein n=1 Tax=Xylanibacillus composti TaxID=1572762 RepID=A0A8J4M2F9_9BACL|nr:ABC transporter substrate-binding protein [Xylanibacillus composti]MDT9723467.1 ABC transporter substrate-binding protein [Xylanibacillus composti]GIQ68496.1 ABC transporter substrate-binding protein [Xylanibacillus composti]